jgi:cell division septum initiation protein DivIVA
MDILHLVDRLEELFNESRPVWFTHSVIVDEDRLLDLIDQMRITIPEEIKKSQQLLTQRDRLLAQAQEEANRTIALAREKSDKLVEKDSVTQAAQVRADQLVAQAKNECIQTKKEADEYVLQTLNNLQIELEKSLSQVKNGILALQVEKQKSEIQTPQPEKTTP